MKLVPVHTVMTSPVSSSPKQLFRYVGRTIQIQYYLEMLKINSSYLWTRNRGQNALFHTGEQKKVSHESNPDFV